MKRIVCLFRAGNSLPLVVAALFALGAAATGPNAAASTRPQPGGTLRVQMNERIATIDPRQWPASTAASAAAERIDSLVFDRLVRLDEHGTPQPALAVSWQHDPQMKRWQFRLRDGVKFSDGAPLTPLIAAMALQQLLGASFDVSATPDSVVIQAEHSLPDFPAELATGRYFIFHSLEDNSLTGTGPFRVAEWPAPGGSAKAVFVANESCWAGRPFVDRIEIDDGRGFCAAGQHHLLWPGRCRGVACIRSAPGCAAGHAHSFERSRGAFCSCLRCITPRRAGCTVAAGGFFVI